MSTTCSYCGVGCQLNLNVKEDVPGGRILRVTSNPQAPINGMHLCVKGRYGYDFIHASNRLLRPRVRKYLLDGTPRPKNRGPWVEVDWDTALKITADGLRERGEKYGPDSIGLLTSGKSLNEENFLMNKLGRQVLGTNNIDCLLACVSFQHGGWAGRLLRAGCPIQLAGRCGELLALGVDHRFQYHRTTPGFRRQNPPGSATLGT